jgi:hypothetical protein
MVSQLLRTISNKANKKQINKKSNERTKNKKSYEAKIRKKEESILFILHSLCVDIRSEK